jgi:hypothetical protein
VGVDDEVGRNGKNAEGQQESTREESGDLHRGGGSVVLPMVFVRKGKRHEILGVATCEPIHP